MSGQINDSGVSLLIELVLTIEFRDCPLETPEQFMSGALIEIVRVNDLVDCLSFGIARTIDVWWFRLIGIVQTNDLGDCLFIRIILKIVFTGSINWNCLNN